MKWAHRSSANGQDTWDTYNTTYYEIVNDSAIRPPAYQLYFVSVAGRPPRRLGSFGTLASAKTAAKVDVENQRENPLTVSHTERNVCISVAVIGTAALLYEVLKPAPKA